MQEQQPLQKRRLGKRTIFGLFLLFFAVIGVISSAVFVTRTAIDLIENKSEKEMFADYVYPLVVLDPPTFDSVDKLDMKTMLTAGIWNLLQNEKLSKYEADEMGFISVPQTDVEAYTTKLFGDGISFTHQALGDASYSFSYNPDEGIYTLPADSIFFPYTPRVSQIRKTGDTIELTVEYLPTGSLIRDRARDREEAQAKKTRLYVLQKLEKHAYKILAVKDPNAPAVSSAAPAASSAAPATSGTAPATSSAAPAVSSAAPAASSAAPATSGTAPATSSTTPTASR